MTILVTVADDRFGRKGGKYGATQDKITALFKRHPNFGVVPHPYKWKDISKTDFYRKNRILLDNPDPAKNGRAYKAYAVSEALKDTPMGEFLIYTDSSPEIWKNITDNVFARTKREHYSMLPLSLLFGEFKNWESHFHAQQIFSLDVIKDLCRQNNDILTSFIRWNNENFKGDDDLGKATHKNFTSNRCMNRMGLRFYEDAYQHAGGMWCIRKTPKTIALVDEWLYWNCIDECCTLGWAHKKGDQSFWTEEAKFKLGFRSDQAVTGLLLARINQKHVVPPTFDGWAAANLFQFCRVGYKYSFLESLPKLKVMDSVMDKVGRNLRVIKIKNNKYHVGEPFGIRYTTTRENLKLIERANNENILSKS